MENETLAGKLTAASDWLAVPTREMMVTLQEEEERMTRYQEEMLTRVMELHQVIRTRSSKLTLVQGTGCNNRLSQNLGSRGETR